MMTADQLTSGGGWTCSLCGAWVPWNVSHNCVAAGPLIVPLIGGNPEQLRQINLDMQIVFRLEQIIDLLKAANEVLGRLARQMESVEYHVRTGK